MYSVQRHVRIHRGDVPDRVAHVTDRRDLDVRPSGVHDRSANDVAGMRINVRLTVKKRRRNIEF